MKAPPVILRTGKPVQTDPDALVVVLDWREIHRGGQFARFTPTEFAMLLALLAARGNVVQWADLIGLMYGHKEDGGPLDPRKGCFVRRIQMKQRMARLGLEISTRWGIGIYASFRPIPSLHFAEAAE